MPPISSIYGTLQRETVEKFKKLEENRRRAALEEKIREIIKQTYLKGSRNFAVIQSVLNRALDADKNPFTFTLDNVALLDATVWQEEPQVGLVLKHALNRFALFEVAEGNYVIGQIETTSQGSMVIRFVSDKDEILTQLYEPAQKAEPGSCCIVSLSGNPECPLVNDGLSLRGFLEPWIEANLNNPQ